MDSHTSQEFQRLQEKEIQGDSSRLDNKWFFFDLNKCKVTLPKFQVAVSKVRRRFLMFSKFYGPIYQFSKHEIQNSIFTDRDEVFIGISD